MHSFYSYCIGINIWSNFPRSLKTYNNKHEAGRNLRFPFCGNYDIFRIDLLDWNETKPVFDISHKI